MKTIRQTIVVGIAMMLLFALRTFAIEGLKVSVQSSNAVLSWPSTNDETFIVQYRPTMNSTSTWLMVTSSLPADAVSNLTFFVHAGSVQYPPPGSGSSTNGGGGFPMPPEGGTNSSSGSTNGFQSTVGFYRVVRTGVHLVGITNGMTLSGVISIPVEVGTDAGDLVTVSVREDGSPVGNSPTVAPFPGPLNVVLDTTVMSNGVHQISGYASWVSGGDEGSGTGVDAESPTITINVYNEISFPSWIEQFGELNDSVLITAQSAHTNADWTVDVYGSNAGYIGTFSGHTTDGSIYGWWDLVGPGGVAYTNEAYFQFVFATVYDDGLPSRPARNKLVPSTPVPKKTYRQTDNWVGKGMWVVANQQAWEGLLGADLLDIATDGFVVIADGGGLTTRPTHQSGEAFRIQFGSGTPTSTKAGQWQSLRNALFHPESRNFFYLGHGSPNGIGASSNAPLFISASAISTNLHTIPAGQTNRHAYRFVFLYGCETASGTLPESFGVIHRENVPLVDFGNAALTPNTFVGWNKKQEAGIVGQHLRTTRFSSSTSSWSGP